MREWAAGFSLAILGRSFGAGAAGGFVPAALKVGEEPGFDFGCDVGVGFDDSVGEVVAEAAGLGDFGCAAGDEPGFVAVAESVEGESGADRVGAHAGFAGAVDGGAEDASVEGGAPQPGAAAGGEEELVGVGLEVLAQQPGEEWWQRDGARGGWCLGWAGPAFAAAFVE
jgi:hypothetical protein